MKIMTSATQTLVWTDRDWQIVSADLDLAHVFLPLRTFRFEPDTRKGIEGYKITHSGQVPAPDCFCETFLVPVGTHRPGFSEITKKTALPLFSKDSATEYGDVAETMAKYTQSNREMQRLEGVIKVPCHAHGAQPAEGTLSDHSPLWIKTLLHVYQFGNVVKGDRPLLVLRAPLSPVCPVNGDGTALGYA
jgi:hypothetical protein